jgi:hypothetical protein
VTTKDSLRDEVDKLKEQTGETDTEVSYYEHPDSGELYNRFKQQIDNPRGIVIHHSWRMAPFIVTREKAKAEGWNVVQSVETDTDIYQEKDMVEVSEWCVNYWVSDPEDRTVISE